MGTSCSKSLVPHLLQTGHTRTSSLTTVGAARVSPESFIALCTQGHLKQALTTHFSLLLSEPTLLSHLFKACIDRGSLLMTQQLHSFIITNGWWQIKFLTNNLLNTYAKLGRLGIAVEVFDKMPQRNIMSCNILVGGYIQNGDLGAAYKMFKEMGRRNSATWNAVISGLIKFEFNEEGLRLFAKMHSDGFSPEVYTLGSVLRGCAGLKDLIMGKQVHSYLIKSGWEFDQIVGNSTTHMYMRCGSLTEGERVIQSMPVHNIVACNTLIAGRVQNGCAEGALDHYYSMKTASLKPDDITFVSVIISCSELSTLGQGQQIHADVVKAGAMPVAAVISSLISMYSGCGCLHDSVKVFEDRGGAEGDHVVWSSMIAAYGFHGKGDKAIKLFNRMELEGLEPNKVTFLSLLYACSHSGLKDKGLELFNTMKEKYGLEPEVKHYTCVVDLLGRAGCLEEAECLIRSMPIKPDSIIWKTLLAACKIHKNADMANRIAENILKANPHDSASYVLLSNIQATANRWGDVSEVRRRMRKMLVKKTPGISWYELGNKIHHFSMGEKSHPQWEEIDLCLKQLIEEVRLHGHVPDTNGFLDYMDLE